MIIEFFSKFRVFCEESRYLCMWDDADITNYPVRWFVGRVVGWSEFWTSCQNYLANFHESRQIYKDEA